MTDKKPHENPSIGIVLCQDANRQFVEIMVRDYDKPMGVATYRTAQEMPENLRKTLPDIDKLQNLLSENDSKSETVRWFIYVRKISGSWMEYKNPCNNHVNYCRDFDLFRPTLVQYIRYHVFYILSDLYEIFIQDAFPFLPRLESVELR